MITYKDAGVDQKKAETLIEKLKERIRSTFNPYVLNPIGGFASLLDVPKEFKDPVIVTSTDGVGTKLKIAQMVKVHRTVGIDLVAMCVNDILTYGAKPFFFLDYFACGKLDEEIYKEVIGGICEGCEEAGCALVGGETAEMPSFYGEGEYDLAGFVLGFVEKGRIVDGSGIKEGDKVIGLRSNGLHSNGYSLARKILFEIKGLNPYEKLEGIEDPLYTELLRPTRIYVRLVLDLLERFRIKGMAHVTGGGIPGNLSRIIPSGLSAELTLPHSEVPLIFRIIKDLGNVPVNEMFSTFNMGIGYILVVENGECERVIEYLDSKMENPLILGEIGRRTGTEAVRITLT